MVVYATRRILISVVVIYLIATFAFLLIRLLPGDPVLLLLGESGATASQETINALRARLGLDQPLLEQYMRWLCKLAVGDLGESLFGYGRLTTLLIKRLANSLELIGFALLLACLLGIPSGLFAAYHQGTFIDLATSLIATLGIATPVYVLAIILILIMALSLKLLPAGGHTPWHVNALEHIRFLVLPVLTLALNQWALISRMTRSSVLDVLQEGYVQTARAKGLREIRLVFVHVLRNALIPVVTLIGLQFSRLFGATVLVEAIFNWPGMSSLLLEGAVRRDYPLIQGLIVILGGIVCITNLLVDLLYGVLDPRVRYE
ncbi:MAG: ABC transporter permease [Thermoproteota archaeon]